MNYTLPKIYEYFFPYRDNNIAEDFANSSEFDMAEVYFDNLQVQPSLSDYKTVVGIMQQIKDIVMSEYNFWLYQEDDTGHEELRVQ